MSFEFKNTRLAKDIIGIIKNSGLMNATFPKIFSGQLGCNNDREFSNFAKLRNSRLAEVVSTTLVTLPPRSVIKTLGRIQNA